MKTVRENLPRSALRRATALAVLALAMSFAPAIADERGRNEQPRGRAEDHRGGEHRDRDRHGFIQGNYYPQPVYVPPVVQYVPPASPGINLFLPLDIHLR